MRPTANRRGCIVESERREEETRLALLRILHRLLTMSCRTVNSSGSGLDFHTVRTRVARPLVEARAADEAVARGREPHAKLDRRRIVAGSQCGRAAAAPDRA